MFRLSASSLFLVVVLSLPGFGQRSLDLKLAALREASHSEGAQAIQAVLKTKPDRDAVVDALRVGVLPALADGAKAGWSLRMATSSRGESFPYQVYLSPRALKTELPMPVLVHFHGSVSRAEFSTKPGDVGYGRILWKDAADQRGFLLVCPLGKVGREWWTDLGVEGFAAVLRDLKRIYPVDDDHIVATGFSDGASGCFHFAMGGFDDVAAFIPMNGHPAVPAGASGRKLYPRNLATTPTFVLGTRDDVLYPMASVLPHFDAALAVDADLRVISWENGNHQPAYFEALRTLILDYVDSARRDTSRQTLGWRFDRPSRRGAVELLEMSEDNTGVDGAQVMSRPGMVRFGIQIVPDRPEGEFLVQRVSKNTAASALGVKAKDRVISVAGVKLENRFSFFQALRNKSFGDSLGAVIERGQKRVSLSGKIPAFVPKPVYRRDGLAAEVTWILDGATWRLDTRGARKLRLLWASEGTPPAEAMVNGSLRKLSWKAWSFEEILRHYLREADRSDVVTHSVELEFKN